MSDAFIDFDDERRWVAWSGNKKVPRVADGTPVDATDPANWMTRLEAEGCARELTNGAATTGIGIALGAIGDDIYLCGIELDSSLDENGCLAPWAVRIISALGTYCEVSPSGRGLKAFFYVPAHLVRAFLDRIGVAPGSWGTKRGIPALSGANHGPGLEIYFGGRYFTVTGRTWSLDHRRIVCLDADQLAELARLIPARSASGSGEYRGGNGGDLDNSRSGKAWRAAIALRAGTFEEMCARLREHPDPAIREWANEVDDRQLQRLWDRGAGKVVARAEARAEKPSAWEAQHPLHEPGEGEPGPSPEPPPTISAGISIDAGVNLLDFYALMTAHRYFWAPSRELWPAVSVNARVSAVPLLDPDGSPVLQGAGKHKGELVAIPASVWLDRHRPVEQVTWAPGEDMVIRNRLIAEGGWIRRPRISCFNLYRPPALSHGDPLKAGPWLDHVQRVYPEPSEFIHIICWLAHRVQRPAEKVNHALVLGGEQGVGKDTILEPVKRAIGPWNGQEESPRTIIERPFNGYLKAVILRISETRDLGEAERHTFYEHMKAYTAAPPDVLRINEKHLREYYIPNVVGVVYTTNHKTDGIHLPEDDRRHFVAWSPRTRSEFSETYFIDLYRWFDAGGDRHVAAYLAGFDLSGFNPKAPPPQTQAFWDIVNASRVPENAELADLLDRLGQPEAVTIAELIKITLDDDGHPTGFGEWLDDRRNRRKIPHRMEDCGYIAVRNPDAQDGIWKVSGVRQVIYSRVDMTPAERLKAAQAWTRQS